MNNSATGIIDILLSQNVIDVQKLTEARNESLINKLPIEKILLDKGWISKNDIIKAKSALYGVPFLDVANIPVEKDMANLISYDEADRFKIFIIGKEGDNYKAAMVNPLDIQTIRYVEKKLSTRLQVYIAEEDALLNRIKSLYNTSVSSEVSSVVQEAVSTSEFVDISENDSDINSIDLNTAPVAKIVNLILENSVDEKASDIHIEPQNEKLRVRFRINGILREVLSLPLQIAPALISRIKILAKMPIDEKRKPLDGRFQIKVSNQEIDLRISSLPTVLGEKIVIRLLRKDLGILSLEDTGLRGNALKTFTEGLKATSGIILVTGPTGSGKTVTVATSINMLNKPEVNIVSIEDPVEIKIPGVNQVQVNEDAGLTLASALRSFLRQDPNVISVGEIRDRETAGLAAQASLTGHLVVSTLHTNSAAGALPRLLDMGVEPYIIASAVNICLAQRLCRRVCSFCKVAYIPDEAESLELNRVLGVIGDFNLQKYAEYQNKNLLNSVTVINQPQISTQQTPNPTQQQPTNDSSLTFTPAPYQIHLFKGKGCDKCGNSGYSGRIGIFEVFKVTEKIGALVMQHKSSEEIEREATTNGMIRMIQDGFLKCLEGTTTLEEVLRVVHT